MNTIIASIKKQIEEIEKQAEATPNNEVARHEWFIERLGTLWNTLRSTILEGIHNGAICGKLAETYDIELI